MDNSPKVSYNRQSAEGPAVAARETLTSRSAHKMFRKLLPVYVVAALAASALLPSPVQAQRTVKYYVAYAYFYEDPEGCDYFETYLDVVESWTRYEPGRTEHTLTVYFKSIQYDACEDVPIFAIVDFVEIP